MRIFTSRLVETGFVESQIFEGIDKSLNLTQVLNHGKLHACG